MQNVASSPLSHFLSLSVLPPKIHRLKKAKNINIVSMYNRTKKIIYKYYIFLNCLSFFVYKRL